MEQAWNKANTIQLLGILDRARTATPAKNLAILAEASTIPDLNPVQVKALNRIIARTKAEAGMENTL